MLLNFKGSYALCLCENQTQGRYSIAKLPKKIIFHCGSAKTGSTTLQAYLWANRAALEGEAIHYCPRLVRADNIDPLNLAIRDVRKLHLKHQAISAGRARLEYLFGKANYHTIIVSNESAFGDPFSDRYPGFFPFLAPALEGLKEMFAGYQLVPIFFVRDQSRLLPSFYGQRVRQGTIESFAAFMERAGSYDLSWQPVITAVSAAFTVPVEVHRFEDFAARPMDYAAALFASHSGAAKLLIQNPTAKNAAAKSHAVDLMLGANKLVDSMGFMKASQRVRLKKGIRRWLFPLFERIKSGFRLQLPAERQTALASLYRDDLKALAIKKGPVQENRP